MAGLDRPALAQSQAPDLSGRWQAERHALVLDISRCGTAWCGIEVALGGTCGREMLRLEAKSPGETRLEGRLELSPESQAYAVEARLHAASADLAPILRLVGHAGTEYKPMRRAMPFHAVLMRSGDPVCRSQRPVS